MRRTRALILKETRQMLRDKSTLTLGIVLPITLLLLFGFGLSLDVTSVPVTVVRDNNSPAVRDLFGSLARSPYFAPVMADSWREAETLLRSGKTEAIVRLEKERPGSSGRIQCIVNGRDSNQARIMQRYLEGAIAQWNGAFRNGGQGAPGLLAGPAGRAGHGAGSAVAEPRIWYNHALESRHFLIPGVTVLIMTLIGTLLTALVIAREWERGTYESLIATPVKRNEILAGKTVPYFLLGMAGLALCLMAAAFVFRVPMQGPLWLIIAGSALYLWVALGIGLLISARVKNQFLASQIVLILSFLPTLMLSGFIFDLQSAPRFIYYLAHVFPSTWYVEFMQTLFLAGAVAEIAVRDCLVLAVFALVLFRLANSALKQSLE